MTEPIRDTAQVLDLANGEVDYTWEVTITELRGKDISAAIVELSVGTYDAPGDTWYAAVEVDGDLTDEGEPPTEAQRVVKLLIGAAPLGPDELEAGEHWLWSRVADVPSLVPRRQSKFHTT